MNYMSMLILFDYTELFDFITLVMNLKWLKLLYLIGLYADHLTPTYLWRLQ